MLTGYFNRRSSTVPGRKLFEDVIDILPIGLNELLYRNPNDILIRMMEDTKMYAISKILPQRRIGLILTSILQIQIQSLMILFY